MSFRIKDGTSYLGYFPGAWSEYGFTSIESAAIFQKLEDSTVYNSQLGAFALYHEQTNKYLIEQWYSLHPSVYIHNEPGMSCFYDDQSKTLNINRYYFGNVELEPLNNEPNQISGQFVNTNNSIEFTGRLVFDGINDYKLTKTIEFNPDGFVIFTRFKPTGTPVADEVVFSRSFLNVRRIGVSNTFAVNSFLTPIEFSSDQDNLCEVYIGVNYTSKILDVRTNGNVFINDQFQERPLYDGTPFVLGSQNYGNYFSGELITFKSYARFIDYVSVVGNYEYGLWAPFDSNINTVHVISAENYYTVHDIKSGYIIRGPGEFQISERNLTIYCKFTAISADEEIFSITSQDYEEFISGSIISLRRVSTNQFVFEYSRIGGLNTLITRVIDITNDIEYEFYMYNSYDQYGSGFFASNMFETLYKSYTPGGFLPGMYTISCAKKDIAVYTGIIPVYEIISASYSYTGNSKTLTETSQTYGEYVDLYLDRYLKIGSKNEKFLGTSIPSYEYFGKRNSPYYESLSSNAYYKNVRFVVTEILPKSLTQNYVSLYDQDDKIKEVYIYKDTSSVNGTAISSITMDNNMNVYIGGYYGTREIVINSTYFPKQINQNIFVSKLNGWKSYGVSVTDVPFTEIPVGYRPRITSMGSDGSNVYVCGITTEDIVVYDSANIGYSIPYLPPRINTIGISIAFLIKYNSLGRIEWTVYSINISSPGPYISVTKTGNVYMACSYYSDGWTYTPTIFRTPHGDVSTPGDIGRIPFYKFTTDGRIEWIAGAGGWWGGTSMSSYTDEYENGYMMGFSQGGLNVINSDRTSTVPYVWRYDNTGYIIKFNPDGIALWYNLFTDGGWTMIQKCVSDSTHIYITGNIAGNVGLQRNDGTITPMNYYPNYWACMVIKLDMDGNFVYRRIIDGVFDEEGDQGFDIKLDQSSNVYLSGQYLSTRGMYIKDGSDENVFTIPPNSSTPGSFIVKYSGSGTPLWERHMDQATADYINENMPVGNQVYTVGISSPSRISWYPNTAEFGTGFYNIYSTDGALVSNTSIQDGDPVPSFNENKKSDKMVLSGYCKLLNEVKLNYASLYINGIKVVESLSNNIVIWTTGATAQKTFKYELHVSDSKFYIEGISTLLPEKTRPDDLLIQRLEYTPIQAQDFPAYDATITRYTQGALYTANSAGNVHVSNVFRNIFFNDGYGYAASYDYTYSNVHITLTANLYGESNLTLTSTDEVYIYVDDTLFISNTGSNVYIKYSEYPFRLEWTGRPEVSLSDSYIQLDGLDPVGNMLSYTKTSNGIHYTQRLLNGNGAAIAQTIEFSGTSPNTLSIISNTNLTCNLTRYDTEDSWYTLKLENTNNLPINETYAYEPEFRSVVLNGYMTNARGNFQANVFDSAGTHISGFFSVPESGTYTVSNIVTPVQGQTFLDTTVFRHDIVSKYYEAGNVVPYSLYYYCPPGEDTNIDVVLSNVNSYLLSQHTTTTEFITRIPNFYRSNTSVANYKTITF
jgi:hypothetical protein